MIDDTGVEWVPAAVAAIRTDVAEATIRSWVHRTKVRGHRVGRVLWVAMPDVADAELATRGRYARQRGRQVQHCAPGRAVSTVR